MVLDGIRILELTAFHSGTVGGALLGQLGADVIKIEDPRHGDPGRGLAQMSGTTSRLPDGRTVMFEAANTDKRSVAIDLKTDGGRRIVHELIARSDVFLSNYRPHVLDRLGLDWETVHELNARLVYVTASGQGPAGPGASARAFDWVGQAMSGMMWAAGDRGSSEPTVVVGGPVDQTGGTLAALAITSGLASRAITGEGVRADVSLLGAAIGMMLLRVDQYALAGRSVTRHGRDESRQPLSNWYRCADGKWLLLCELQSDRFWKDFCALLDRPELADDERFVDARARRKTYAELIQILDEVFLQRDRDEWVTRFAEALPDFVVAPILDEDEILTNEQARANGYLVEWPGSGGAHATVVGSPITFQDNPASMRRAAPELGQDTEQVLLDELGYGWDDIAKLRDEMVF
jgi:crotonobetainyl-CoA:carnitine CoA-transferase CaiB-like acyl-CoA transferase